MAERDVQNQIRLDLAGTDVKLFRNNVGTAWAGQAKHVTKAGFTAVEPGDVIVRKARPLHAGLMVGSGDLIGWRTITITPDMVGQRVAVFASVEVKDIRGKAADAQITWMRNVLEAGGLACIAKNSVDAKKGLAFGVSPAYTSR